MLLRKVSFDSLKYFNSDRYHVWRIYAAVRLFAFKMTLPRTDFNPNSLMLYLCLQVTNRDLLHCDRTEGGELQRSLSREKEDFSIDLERESGRIRHERAAYL